MQKDIPIWDIWAKEVDDSPFTQDSAPSPRWPGLSRDKRTAHCLDIARFGPGVDLGDYSFA
jgi:hypothetical protein